MKAERVEEIKEDRNNHRKDGRKKGKQNKEGGKE